MAFSNEEELDIEAELTDFVTESEKVIALNALRFLVFASPVDTGRFAANWIVGINAPDNSFNKRYSSQRNVITRGRKKIKAAKVGIDSVIWISNNLPYARRLNNGWSEQAPKFFVEKAARRAGVNINDGEL